ncbi:T9SS type A sorting domain-containing protein [Flavobacterium ardleyense]|uniref:T9SS type A sorting domain-containing protein n=1 Tax=Flavobacterium ardleyense TaxID=2038737 RepID=A0ABW5ZDG8_9FLAO
MKKTLLLALFSAFIGNAQTVTDYVTGISSPSGIVFDATGNLFIGDYLNYKIIKVDLLGNKTTITSSLAGSPNQITLDSNNNIWASCEISSKLTKVTQAGVQTSYPALGNAYGVAIDALGFVYFSENGPGNINKLDVATGTITVFKTGLIRPRGLVFDANGDLIVACGGSANKIIKITPSGDVTDVVTAINSPYYLALNSNGDLYISTNSSGGIYQFLSGATNGSQVLYATGLGTTNGLAIRNNELFVARQGSGLNKISKITLPTLGLNDVAYENNEILVYPNPATEFVCVENISADANEIELFDLNGKSVRSYKASDVNAGKLIITNLQSGNYILKIDTISKKIIIK